MTVATVIKTVGPSGRNFSTVDTWCDAAPADLTTSERWTAGTFGGGNGGVFIQGETVTGTGLTTGKFLDSDGSTYVTFGISSGNSNTLVTLTGSSSLATCIVAAKTDTGIIWKGESDGTLSGGNITIPSTTTSTTCYFWLRPASGQAFNDNGPVALRYNTANGTALAFNSFNALGISFNQKNVLVEDMQMQYTPGSPVTVFAAVNSMIMRRCIVENTQNTSFFDVNSSSGSEVTNCLLIPRVATLTQSVKIGSGNLYNTTVLRPTDLTVGGGAISNNSANYPRVLNTVVIGSFTTMFAGTLANYVATTGFNASSVATGSMPGANNVGSLTASNELTVVVNTNTDARPKSGNSLQAGTPDATHTANLDILKQARSLTTPTIGCCEFIGGVNVSLTGVSSSSGVGSLTANVVSPLTGVAATCAVGTLVARVNATLTGVSSTCSPGTLSVSASSNLTLVGVAATCAAGTITAEIDFPLSGVSSTCQNGTITAQVINSLVGVSSSCVVAALAIEIDLGLTGVSATGTPGTLGVSLSTSVSLVGVSASGLAADIEFNTHASGVESFCSPGNLVVNILPFITGTAATGQAGTITTATSPETLTGVSATGAAETLTAQIIPFPLGVSSTGEAGTITASVTSTTVSLTGVFATGQVEAFVFPSVIVECDITLTDGSPWHIHLEEAA